MPHVSKPTGKPRGGKATKPQAIRKPSVLLVEDDQFLAGMYGSKLELEGYHVVLARDGAEGWKLARTSKPDLVLLDLVLPKMSGFEILEHIRATPDLASTPVILLTNLGQREDVRRGLELGADDYLIKAHFMPSEVIDKIKRRLKPGTRGRA